MEGEQAEIIEEEEDLNDIRNDMPLGEGVLKVNLGIPIIVVC